MSLKAFGFHPEIDRRGEVRMVPERPFHGSVAWEEPIIWAGMASGADWILRTEPFGRGPALYRREFGAEGELAIVRVGSWRDRSVRAELGRWGKEKEHGKETAEATEAGEEPDRDADDGHLPGQE